MNSSCETGTRILKRDVPKLYSVNVRLMVQQIHVSCQGECVYSKRKTEAKGCLLIFFVVKNLGAKRAKVNRKSIVYRRQSGVIGERQNITSVLFCVTANEILRLQVNKKRWWTHAPTGLCVSFTHLA